MFKKIVNFFFTEEEMVHEEELDREDKSDQLKMHPLKPIVAKEPEISRVVRPVAQVDSESSALSEVETTTTLSSLKKSLRIDVDDPISSVREVVLKKETHKPITPNKYQPTEIISPIYGGPKPSEKVNPVSSIRQEVAKKNVTSSVISPIFGAVESEAEPKQGTINMDLKVSDLLSPERSLEDVQVSLYDFLEEMEDNG